MTNEALDPNKYHVMNKKRRILAVLVIVVILAVLAPLIGYGYYKFAVFRPSQNINETKIEIKNGESVYDISRKLYREDVINSEFLFKFYIIVNKMENSLQAGDYVIPGGASVVDVADYLKHGTKDTSITFLEGWRVEEFAKEASEKYDKIDYAEFVLVAKDMEGYLFPDTYSFSVNVTEEQMVDRLEKNFEEKTKEILSDDNLRAAGLTKEQAVIFASILEREINNDNDKPIVAGILIKRFKEGELVGADATTQYTIAASRYGCPLEGEKPLVSVDDVCPNAENVLNIEWWPNDMTIEELDVENPYNTRELVGLPPAPIANPGLSSINAVRNAVETEYYYYLNNAAGETIFSKTLDEHNFNALKHL